MFSQRRAVGVVLTEHQRAAERVAELRAEVGARRTLEVGRVGEATVTAHETGQADSDGDVARAKSVMTGELAYLLGQHRGRRRAGVVALELWRGRLHLAEHASVARDEQRERLGATDVDADRDVAHALSSA